MPLNFISQTLIKTILIGRFFVNGAFDLGYQDDSDLTSFVSRPEIRVPLFDIAIHDHERVTPGYWFVSPYGNIMQETFARKYYQPCQTGPAIYDGNGDLVWTGACSVKNLNICDFRLIEHNDSYILSAIAMANGEGDKGRGTIMDPSYTVIKNVTVPKLVNSFNMHEFKLVNGGKSALLILHRSERIELDPELQLEHEREIGWIMNMGFQEVDVETGESLFEWWAYPEVRPQESKVQDTGLEGPYPGGWNWFHMNSVEKNSEGDYMISSRFTDTIFKISGQTGKLEWRLEGSGTTSSFTLQNFNFSRQHDARWLEHTKDREVISFFNNAADTHNETSTYSSSLIVELDKISWVARVLKRWDRPDQRLTRLRGNTQVLENGNIFTCWSDNSYISEHTAEGELLMSASFRSKRFVTYRGYKFNFTGAPLEPPVLTASAYGTRPDRSTTVSHVSWIGATEMSSWSFYSTSNNSEVVLLGTERKTGFETSFHSDGFVQYIYAEALAASGEVLGRTSTFEVEAPGHWHLDPSASSRKSSKQGRTVHTVSSPELGDNVELDLTSSGGCSVYGTGCKPMMQHKNIGVVPTGKTEL